METTKAKRVVCLYRVSTSGQVDKNDIPLQKQECRDFIQQQGWSLVKEYYEKGVSGYKKSANERDELQKVMSDARNKLFDVLLVFMFDRLGRKEDETPFVVEWFVKQGIEVWSTQEGRQNFDNHVDKLMNYLRFWQSAGESQKTSMRVDVRHKQMVKEGLFRGGKPPYGYKLVESGQFNKKKKELMKLAIDEKEGEIVKIIYDLAHDKGYGGVRITKYLNENNIKSRTGVRWNSGVINYILKNPIYKGYMTYGKTSCKDGHIPQSKDKWVYSDTPIQELIIVDEGKWERVQEIKKKRMPMQNNKTGENIEYSNPFTKSKLLFVGMIECGHCGSPLTTTYNCKTWINKDGTEKRHPTLKYRCSGKALAKKDCDGQTIYAQKKIENAVLKKIYNFLNILETKDFNKEINKYKKKYLTDDQKTLRQLQKAIEKKYSELNELQQEVVKSIKGESHFKPELLSKLIDEKEQEIEISLKEIKELEFKIKEPESEIKNMQLLQKIIPKWKNIFEQSEVDEKKVLLSYIVDKIVVTRDGIEVKIKLITNEFINSTQQNKGEILGCKADISGSTIIPNILPNKYLEETLIVSFNKTA